MCCIIMTMQDFPRKRDIFRDWIISNSSVMYNTCIGLTLYSFITIWLTKSLDTTVNVIVLAWRRYRHCGLFLCGMLSQRSFETAWHSFDVTVITGDCAQIARFMGPTWGPPGSCQPPDGPHVGPMNLAIRVMLLEVYQIFAIKKLWWFLDYWVSPWRVCVVSLYDTGSQSQRHY